MRIAPGTRRRPSRPSTLPVNLFRSGTRGGFPTGRRRAVPDGAPRLNYASSMNAHVRVCGLACLITAVTFACGSDPADGDGTNGNGNGNGSNTVDGAFIQNAAGDGSSNGQGGDGGSCVAP